MIGQGGPNFGRSDTDFTGSLFLGFTGIGIYVAPPSGSLNFNWQTSASPSDSAQTLTGCVRSILIATPIVTLQLSASDSSGSGDMTIVDASLSIGLSLSLGAFGGFNCSATIKSPTQPGLP